MTLINQYCSICNHYFVIKDAYWCSCIYCGMLKPNAMKLLYKNNQWEDEKGVPIAPNDQEKVEAWISLMNGHDPMAPLPNNWHPEIGKLYDSGDLGFELKEIEEPIWGTGGAYNTSKKVWVLKEKAKEEISKELRSVRKDLFSPCEKAILNAQYELEKVGASEELTKAAILLSEARQLVTNYLYEKNN